MSWRAIQSTTGVSTSLAALTDREERIWWRLLAHSDSWGRLDARPAKVRALCFPLLPHITDWDLRDAFEALELHGRIVVYTRGEWTVVQIIDFEKHQPREAFRKRATSSVFPEPPSTLEATPGLLDVLFRNLSGNLPEPKLGNMEIAGDSGTTPDTFRNTSGDLPAQSRRDESRKEVLVVEPSSSLSRAKLRQLLDDDDLEAVLNHLDCTDAQATLLTEAAAQEPARLKAAITAGLQHAERLVPYVLEIIRNGTWPEEKHAPSATTPSKRSVLQHPTCPIAGCGIAVMPPTTIADHIHTYHEEEPPPMTLDSVKQALAATQAEDDDPEPVVNIKTKTTA